MRYHYSVTRKESELSIHNVIAPSDDQAAQIIARYQMISGMLDSDGNGPEIELIKSDRILKPDNVEGLFGSWSGEDFVSVIFGESNLSLRNDHILFVISTIMVSDIERNVGYTSGQMLFNDMADFIHRTGAFEYFVERQQDILVEVDTYAPLSFPETKTAWSFRSNIDNNRKMVYSFADEAAAMEFRLRHA